MGIGLVVLAVMAAHAGDDLTTWTLLPGQLVAGMGMGIALPPLFDFILAGVSQDEVGSASGVLNAVQQLGGALGIAIVATIFFGYAGDARPTGGTLASTTWWTVLLLAAAFVAVWRLPRHAREQQPAG
jgi:MFS family permease